MRDVLEWARWIVAAIALVAVTPFVTFVAAGIVWPIVTRTFDDWLGEDVAECASLWRDATNSAPTLHDQHVVVRAERTVFPLDLHDPDDDEILEPRVVKAPRHGQAYGWPRVIDPGPSFAYVPEPGFVGTDSIVMDVSDGRSRSRYAVVALEVRAGREEGTEHLSMEATR